MLTEPKYLFSLRKQFIFSLSRRAAGRFLQVWINYPSNRPLFVNFCENPTDTAAVFVKILNQSTHSINLFRSRIKNSFSIFVCKSSERYRLEVAACFRKPNMPEQTHAQLAALGVPVDRAPYELSFEDTVDYLARKIPQFSIVVACQGVRDVYFAYEKLAEKERAFSAAHRTRRTRRGGGNEPENFYGSLCRRV